MILNRFKQNSNKNYINKLLKSRRINVSASKIKTVGVVINQDETFDNKRLDALLKQLKIESKNVKQIVFTEKKMDEIKDELIFSPKDFGWHGNLKRNQLKDFANTNFDVLISVYGKDLIQLKLLTALTKANFKVGILQTDKRINDLTISIEKNDFIQFNNELIKYLKILNKL